MNWIIDGVLLKSWEADNGHNIAGTHKGWVTWIVY